MASFILAVLLSQAQDLRIGPTVPVFNSHLRATDDNGKCQLENSSIRMNGCYINATAHEEHVPPTYICLFLSSGVVLCIISSFFWKGWLCCFKRASMTQQGVPEEMTKPGNSVAEGAHNLFEFLGIPETEFSDMSMQQHMDARAGRPYVHDQHINFDSLVKSAMQQDDSSNVQDLLEFLALGDEEFDAGSGDERFQSCHEEHIFEPNQVAGVNHCTSCNAFIFCQWGADDRGPCDRGFVCRDCCVVFCSSCMKRVSAHCAVQSLDGSLADCATRDNEEDLPRVTSNHTEAQEMLKTNADQSEVQLSEFDRFRRARPNSNEEAIKMYEAHLEWRKGQGLPEELLKSSLAIPHNYVRLHGCALDGSPMILVQGARYDPTVSPELYVLAICHLLDVVQSRIGNEKLTIVVDTRPRKGWPNVLAHRMVPLFKLCAAVLPDNYPERVQRVIIFPLPTVFAALWRMVQKFLDPVTADKFIVFGGSLSSFPKGVYDFIAPDQFPA